MCGTFLFLFMVSCYPGITLCFGGNALVLQSPVGQVCLKYLHATDMLVPIRQIEGVNATGRQQVVGSHSSIPRELPDQCQPSPSPEWAFLSCLPATLGTNPMGNNEDPGSAFGTDVRHRCYFEQSPFFCFLS